MPGAFPASSPLVGPLQVVSTAGSDSANGSWGAPKLTLSAAVTALPNGGTIFVLPGDYTPAATLSLAGHSIIGLGNTRNDLGYTYGAVRIRHAHTGHLIRSTANWGFRLENVCLYEDTYNQGGAAIYHDTANGSPGSYLYLRNVQITGAGWTSGIYIDASASAGVGGAGGGSRSVWIDNTYVFGCVNYNFYAHTLLHAYVSNCGFNPAVVGTGAGGAAAGYANAAMKSYITIAGSESRDIHFHHMDLVGDLAYAGTAGGGTSPSFFSGMVTGNVTFTGTYAHFDGLINGGFSGGATSKYLNKFTGVLS